MRLLLDTQTFLWFIFEEAIFVAGQLEQGVRVYKGGEGQ